jgi:hypothetical protein
MLKAGSPGATCTWTVTLRASMPSNATVATRWTMLHPNRETGSAYGTDAITGVIVLPVPKWYVPRQG